MNDFLLIRKNLFRKKLRAILMLISILIAFLIFGVLAGFERAFNAGENVAAADRLVKFHESVGNRSRDTFIFPRTTHQVVVFVVEGREYIVAIFVGFNAAPV